MRLGNNILDNGKGRAARDRYCHDRRGGLCMLLHTSEADRERDREDPSVKQEEQEIHGDTCVASHCHAEYGEQNHA